MRDTVVNDSSYVSTCVSQFLSVYMRILKYAPVHCSDKIWQLRLLDDSIIAAAIVQCSDGCLSTCIVVFVCMVDILNINFEPMTFWCVLSGFPKWWMCKVLILREMCYSCVREPRYILWEPCRSAIKKIVEVMNCLFVTFLI